MTPDEIIVRAAFEAHKFEPDTAMDRLTAAIEVMFPTVVEELVQSVAANIRHPWRNFIADTTDPISNGDTIPASGAGGKVILGNYGYVRDTDNGKICTGDLDFTELQTIITNVNDWNTFEIYSFLIITPRIFHTRESVTIDVCVYDPDDVTTNLTANIIPIFPDAAGAYVQALVAKMANNATFQVDDYALLTK